jgi:zinc D-Ala-D-Ala carboxypeptidase
MSAVPIDYAARIAAIHRELGIPPDYAERRGLSLQSEAVDIVSIGPDDQGRDCLLSKAAAEAFRTMRARAKACDIALIPLSGFRSVERQCEIIRGKLALGETIDEILRTMAAPGYSEHHTGHAIDVGTNGVLPLEEAFATTAAFAWLARHGPHFGFQLSYPKNNRHGFIYEPWHWCWRATPLRT